MSKRAAPVEPEQEAQEVDVPSGPASEDDLIQRATADRSAGRDTADQVEELVQLAAKRNKAALDRLAK